MTVKFLVAGDFFIDPNFMTRFDTANILSPKLRQFILQHDYRVVNFEAAIGEGCEPIPKSGPNLCALEASASTLQRFGFDSATLANNHAMDFGEQGLIQTISALKSHGLSVVGAGSNIQAARRPLTVTLKGQKIALLNYCQHEWGVSKYQQAGVAGFDAQRDLSEIRQLKSAGYVTVVITHMGHEHFQGQTPTPKNIIELYAQGGADVIINHHPHVTGGRAKILDSFSLSSIGNFLFTPQLFDAGKVGKIGAIGSLEINSGKVLRAEMVPISWNPEKDRLDFICGDSYEEWEKGFHRLSAELTSEHEAQRALEKLCILRKKEYLSRVEPIDNKVLRALKALGIFRGFWPRRRKRALLNVIRCEAHREALIRILEDELEGGKE